MEITDLWGIYTLILLFIFVGIWFWAWSGKRKKSFNEAANLPLADDAPDANKDPDNGRETHS